LTSSKHNPDPGYKLPVRLTTFEKPNPNQNGCLKRDRQLVSSGPQVTSGSRKDAAVHVSLSSDEIVKQRSEEISPRSTRPQGARALSKPNQTQTPTLPFSPPNPAVQPDPKAKRADFFPPPPLREGEKLRRSRSLPTNPLNHSVSDVVGRRLLGEPNRPVKRLFEKSSA
jgi:hypothetical protein